LLKARRLTDFLPAKEGSEKLHQKTQSIQLRTLEIEFEDKLGDLESSFKVFLRIEKEKRGGKFKNRNGSDGSRPSRSEFILNNYIPFSLFLFYLGGIEWSRV
jgi:hypothetical protein